MTAEELEERVRSGQAPIILDVRSLAEFQSGHIQGALHAPLMNIVSATQSFAPNKNDALLLVCEHGPRAQLAKGLLKWHGYKQIELLSGHMAQWRQMGRAVQKGHR